MTATMAIVLIDGGSDIPREVREVNLDTQTFSDLMTRPVVGVAEQGLPVPSFFSPEILTITLRTRTAFQIDPTECLVNAVVQRRWLDPDRAPDATLAVHEALSNAIFHGNLEIDGGNPETVDEFLAHANLVKARLDSANFGQRPLTLSARFDPSARCLEFQVQDAGPGFAGHSDGEMPPPSAKSGRGIGLMIAHSDGLGFEDGGCRTVLMYIKSESLNGSQ